MDSAVVVAVNGTIGGEGSNRSRRALRWAIENLLPHSERIILVHAVPTVTSIPTPSGVHIPLRELDANVVDMYVKNMKEKSEEVFIPFKKICKSRKVETLVLEGDNPAIALLTYLSESGVKSLVLGSCSSNCILRKIKGPGIPSIILSYAPQSCSIYVVSRHKLVTKFPNSSSINETSSRCWMFSQREVRRTTVTYQQISNSNPFSMRDETYKTVSASSMSVSYMGSNAIVDYEQNGPISGLDSQTVKSFSSMSSTNSIQLNVQGEIEQLRLELQEAGLLYKQACEDLALEQNKVNTISLECLDEVRKVNTAVKREENFKKIAAEEKTKRLEAMKEVELARGLLAKEASERKIAEVGSLKESSDRQKAVQTIVSSDWICRKYGMREIEVATDFFSESKVVGVGGFGKVYRCTLDHTPVAIKVLHPDATQRKEEFRKEVEVLSCLRHPHMVSLLGACPEIYCLVYEYMENGSLDDHIFTQNSKSPLPWVVRFRIAFEIGCGLAFLHNSTPEPIVHRDLKPGNILLDRNFVSKIGDVGLAKLILDLVPDDMTQYRESILAGTLFYMDPEYQRTGTVRPKSDLYAFGVIILQLLTGRKPKGLILTAEKAIAKGSFVEKLDKSVTDWPLAETEELARIALNCCKLRCRDRPDLDTEVLPVLKRLADIAEASVKSERSNLYAPSHYFCPILQEVMEDPFIAADGFTYEGMAIKAWLEKHKISPVTKHTMKHTVIIPNYTLRSAIQAWRSRVAVHT